MGRQRERRLEEQLRGLEAQLLESERRRVEAEQRLERFIRVAGAVAHDVNSLLGVVALIGSSLRDLLPVRVREQAEGLCDAAIRAARLNRRLLALGSEGAGSTEEIDVNAVIQGMRRVLERVAGPSHDLVVELDEEPCLVHADAMQIERVILNLVTNARDAMSTGGGRLTIETAHAVSSPDAPHAGSAIVVRVSDTGAGMDVATQRHIFEPYFTTKGEAGTGLGLAAVQDIVAACGGRVEVESRPGRGTRFEIVLPVNPGGGTLPASAPSIV
jgi:signal transduction histidine kinase